MNPDELRKHLAQTQANLDQLWLQAEMNLPSLKQIIGVAIPSGIITSYLTLVLIQAEHNVHKRQLDD